MYLKSLTLKGFKSFADKSVLPMEPGITAVVGPNGSGKSNISDSVLWVLGERNAKHLRGSSMEDVIFAGSSARKATGLAEVELVLDNSDGKLPVDYDEVAITRRMYRTGESEYLINGTVARRMDVLDILHDTGLGTGTHSIISQGSLDSILQSKPEDRRALIEEAAGVLKHKQRKAKSERKLANMDNTLARVRDVVGEVERQLGPLERKAKKARQYQELSGELSEVSLALAVDDLRQLRRSWDDACNREQLLVSDLQVKHQAISDAEAEAEALQDKIRKQTEQSGDLSKLYQRASNAVERFDGASLLLHEKRRAAQSYEADVRVSLESGHAKRAAAVEERAGAEATLASVLGELSSAQAKVDELDASRKKNAETRRDIENELDKLEREKRTAEREDEQDRRKLSETREVLANGLAHVKLVEARAKELELALGHAEEQAQKLSDARKAAQDALDAVQAEESAARAAVAAAIKTRDEARAAAEEAHREVTVLESQIAALEEVERASAAAGPARNWVIDQAERRSIALSQLSHAVRAPEGFESLVELLLASDISALMVGTADEALTLADALVSSGESGQVSLLPVDAMRAADAARNAALACGGKALLDMIEYSADDAAAVEAMLGDVVVCDSLSDAREAQASHPAAGVRFVTAEGAIAWPSGKLSVGASEDASAGALSRARKLDESRAALVSARESSEQAKQAEAAAEAALRDYQAESLRLSQKLAEQRGVTQAAQSEALRATNALESARRDFADVQKQREQAQQTVAEARPTVEALEKKLAAATEAASARTARIDELNDQVVPLRKEAAHLRDSLSEAKLSAATLCERHSYAERIVAARTRDVESVDAAESDLRANLASKIIAQQRITPLLAIFEELTASARRRTYALEQAAQAAQDSSTDLHAQVNKAREVSKAAHDAYDGVNAQLSTARVEKGRLEVQVDTAVNAIVTDLNTPLETALKLPELANRPEAEDSAFKLKRRIANMGSINPDAAAEYEELKARFDYLSAQLSDLDSARRSLAKIVRVIDARMKDDFTNTFAQVNDNFREIFATLFPGGKAELTLTDPDDVENTGVEVNAQPAGKRITKMMLMSGGEKSLTALALLFAVYRIRSAPFYILDEVEAALDDSNLRRLTAYLQSIRNDTQLIMITHQRRTMEMSDVLFGVSMQSDGVTKVISQRLEQALKHAE
jgi:chromosome segregation protein